MLYIFDKDGTLCESVSGKKYINSLEDQGLMPGVAARCQALRAQGHRLAVASNQGGVAFGIMTYEAANDIVEDAASLIEAVTYRMSPYHPKGRIAQYAIEHPDRKPGPGMLLSIMAELAASPAETIFIGDRPEDEQAAQAADVAFVWAKEFFS